MLNMRYLVTLKLRAQLTYYIFYRSKIFMNIIIDFIKLLSQFVIDLRRIHHL